MGYQAIVIAPGWARHPA